MLKIPYWNLWRKKIAKLWHDSIMHLGNTTTNKVEIAHGRFRQYLQDSKGGLVKGWVVMHTMLTL